MAEIQSQKVLIHYEDRPPTEGEVLIQKFSKKDRIRNGLTGWGIVWGLAIVAIFIPVLHFVLVPLFLVAGPFVGIFLAKREIRLAGGKGVCPVCRSELPIEKGKVEWPLPELCTHCRRQLTIQPASESSPLQ